MGIFFDTVSRKYSKTQLVIDPEPTLKIGRPERARAEILNAALRFLWSQPFRNLTVNKLMEDTSISRAAFYYHFADIHELMETLLQTFESEIMAGASPWFEDAGDPVALLHQSLAAEARLCYNRGPMLKAITDAAGNDAQLEQAWYGLLDRFDDAVSQRIAADQELGLVRDFDPRPVAAALNQTDAALYVRAFGRKPRAKLGPVLDAISRLWISSIYGEQWVVGRASTLYRKVL